MISRDDVIALAASHNLEAMALEILVRFEIEEIDLFLMEAAGRVPNA